MYLKCNICGKNSVFIFPWLAGDNNCNKCSKQFEYRRKNGLCLMCGSSEKVFFSGKCDKCHKLQQPNEFKPEKNIGKDVKVLNKLKNKPASHSLIFWLIGFFVIVIFYKPIFFIIQYLLWFFLVILSELICLISLGNLLCKYTI